VRAPGGEPTRITKEDGSYVEIGYDAALRITSERYYTSVGEHDDELLYTYDADGNRATKSVNGVVSTVGVGRGCAAGIDREHGVRARGALRGYVPDARGRGVGGALAVPGTGRS